MTLFKNILLILLLATCSKMSAQNGNVSVQVATSLDSVYVPDIAPRFPACEETGLEGKALNKCAQDELYTLIFQLLKYPVRAMSNRIQGTVVVSFIVEKDGSMSAIEAVKKVNGGCTEEVLRIVKFIQEKDIEWIPGKIKDKPVRSKFYLPVRFAMEFSENKSERKKKKKGKQ